MSRATRRHPGRESAKAATAAAAAQQNGALPSELTLSNGIVLALRPIPPGIIERAIAHLEKPNVPMVVLKDKGGRKEENPGDPDYVDALAAHSRAVIETSTNVMLLVGTAIKSIPDGLYGPDDDGWFDADLMGYLGVEAERKTKYDRYLSWLNLYGLACQEDVLEVLEAVTKMAGLGEEDVQAAVARFRSRKARRTD
jgi:hypothetical protein